MTGSAAGTASTAHIGVAAATKLEFSVSPAPAQANTALIPPWMWWVLIGLLVAAVTILGARRYGLRIRLERKSPHRSAAGQGDSRG